MTPEQMALVQQTWSQVEPIADAAAALFYDRLFQSDPRLAQLFARTDMESQAWTLTHALTFAVCGLDDVEELAPVLRGLGERHAGFGVKPDHYPVFGAALLWTLERGLGELFTAEVRDAWTSAYQLLATLMLQGAAAAAPVRAVPA